MSHGPIYVPVVSLLGDSIDHGFGASTLAGYEEGVYNAAKADGTPIFFVGTNSVPGGGGGMSVDPWNDAVNGSNIGVFPSAGVRPDIIIAGGGTNNVGAGQTANQVLTAFSGALDTWVKIVALRTWGRVIFRNILLRNDAQAGTYNPIIQAINAGLQGVVNGKSYASQVTIVDVASVVNPLTQLNGDGLHPIDAGYANMAVPIYAALKPAIASVMASAAIG